MMTGENGYPVTPDWQDPRTVVRKCCSITTTDLVCEVCFGWTRIPENITLGSE